MLERRFSSGQVWRGFVKKIFVVGKFLSTLSTQFFLNLLLCVHSNSFSFESHHLCIFVYFPSFSLVHKGICLFCASHLLLALTVIVTELLTFCYSQNGRREENMPLPLKACVFTHAYRSQNKIIILETLSSWKRKKSGGETQRGTKKESLGWLNEGP